MAVETTIALILSVIAGLGHFVKESHIKKCDCLCIKSDCHENNIDKELEKLMSKIDKNRAKIETLKKKKDNHTPTSPSCSSLNGLEIFTEKTTEI